LAALKQLSGNKNDAMCVVLLRLIKKKNFNTVLSFCQRTRAPHLTGLSKVFQAGCFDFEQVKTSVELCINKLSDAAAKSELEVNCEKFDSELGDLGTLDDLADSCVSSGEGCRTISELIVSIHKRETGVNEPSTAASFY